MDIKDLKEEYDEQQVLALAFEQAKLEDEYRRYAAECACGMRTVLARLQNLQDIARLSAERNPFAEITSRIKTFESVARKCEKKGYLLSMDTIKKKIGDVAGIRIVVNFRDDISRVAEMIAHQPSLTIVEKMDYTNSPKDSGYRSLHLDTLMTIYLEDSSRAIPVEIQIRSKAMDLWASIEHIVGYKNAHPSPKTRKLFQEMSEVLDRFDSQAIELRDYTDISEKEEAPVAPKRKRSTKNPAK